MHQAQWSPERPLPPPVSLASQSHHEKPPEVTCTSRGNPGFPASIRLLLKQLPHCKAIVTTGQKATDIIRSQIEVKEPAVGKSCPFEFEDRSLLLYRMPSSSRAYPLALEKKADFYRLMLNELGILQE